MSAEGFTRCNNKSYNSGVVERLTTSTKQGHIMEIDQCLSSTLDVRRRYHSVAWTAVRHDAVSSMSRPRRGRAK